MDTHSSGDVTAASPNPPAPTQPPPPPTPPQLPYELLLLSQALVQHGATADFKAISNLVQSHPAITKRSSTISPSTSYAPEALSVAYRHALKTHGLEAARESDATKPNARIHLKLARLYYMERLAELRTKLSSQEDRMKHILKEQHAISSGAQDASLTTDYQLLHKSSEDPKETVYAHKFSAAAATATASTASAALTTAVTANNVSALANQTSQSSEQPDGQAVPSISSGRIGDSNQQAENWRGQSADPDPSHRIPKIEEDVFDLPMEEDPVAQQSVTVSASTDNPPLADGSEDRSRVSGSRTSHAERRSSARNSRPISAAPEASTDPGAVGKERVYPHLMPLSHEDENAEDLNSSHRPTISPLPASTQEQTESTLGREHDSRERSSPASEQTGDYKRRNRSSTPQVYGTKDSSPVPSDRSRSKRVKTEDPDSALGTPDPDRTPLGSEISTARRFKNSAPHLINQMQGSVYSTYFKDPVRPGEALNYFEIIKRPMDLKTLSQNVRSGKVTTSTEFTRDLTLIFANAIMYNGAEHHVGRDALAMWREAQGLLRVLEAAEQRAM